MKAKKPKKHDENSQTLRQYLAGAAEAFDVPIAAAMDLPSVEFTQVSVLIERHHGITEYNSSQICVAARDCAIKISGAELEIHSMSNSELDIRGRIAAVEFI